MLYNVVWYCIIPGAPTTFWVGVVNCLIFKYGTAVTTALTSYSHVFSFARRKQYIFYLLRTRKKKKSKNQNANCPERPKERRKDRDPTLSLAPPGGMAMGQEDKFPLWQGSVEMAQTLMLSLEKRSGPRDGGGLGKEMLQSLFAGVVFRSGLWFSLVLSVLWLFLYVLEVFLAGVKCCLLSALKPF